MRDMDIYQQLKSTALELVRIDYPDKTESELDHWIINTGYGDYAPEPYESIRSLIYVYAANLLNSGLRGPNIHSFGKLASDVISKHFIKDNAITQIALDELAQRFLEELQSSDIQLTKNGNQKYIEDLRYINSPNRSAIKRLLLSIIGFCDLLRDSYQSSAAVYHRKFLEIENFSFSAINHMVKELTQFELVGVALAMNFMKDSQMPAVADGRVSIHESGLIQYLVKPDMHVMRFMLHITKRYRGSIDNLFTMSASEFNDLYTRSVPEERFSDDNGNVHLKGISQGEVLCINDMYTLSAEESIPPVFLDRIIYLIGSGSFDSKKRLSTRQLDRYRSALSGIHEQYFEIEMYEEPLRRLNSVIQLIRSNAGNQAIAREHNLLLEEIRRADAKAHGVNNPNTE